MSLSVRLSYTILIVCLILSCVISLTVILVKQQRWNNRFGDIDDMDKCPNTAKYFALYQGIFWSWTYGALGGGFFGLLLLFVLAVNNAFTKDKIGGEKVISLVLFSGITVGLIVYKLINCTNSRMCGQTSCAAPFFWNMEKGKD